MLKSKQSQETRTVGHPTLTSLSTSLSPFSTFSMWKMEDHKKKKNLLFNVLFFLFFFFLGPHLKHMEVPRLEVKLELQLPTYTTATTTRDLRSA